MHRHFNTAGPCKPDLHDMLPPERRVPEVRALVDAQSYFVLYAPRQVGTSMLDELFELKPDLKPKPLRKIKPEERLEGLAPEQRLAGIAPAQRVLALADEVLRAMPDSYLATLPDDAQAKLRAHRSPARALTRTPRPVVHAARVTVLRAEAVAPTRPPTSRRSVTTPTA